MELLIGAIVSLAIEGFKKQGLSGWHTRAILLLACLLGAGAYTFLVGAGYWPSVLKTLVSAGAFYAFVIGYFKE